METKKQPNKDPWDSSHRPWPLPNLPWIMKQTWNDLLFAHYPVKYDLLRELVPDVLDLDTYDRTYWIGLVPFHMTGIRGRGLPPIPGTSKFPELNVRTYVKRNGKPGVYFFSLDAENWLAVKGANTFYHLPYVYAHMSVDLNNNDVIHYKSRRSEGDANLMCNYRPVSEPFHAKNGSFDAWMSERYCLYTVNKKGIPLRCDILHQPWQLQHAEAEITENSMLRAQGLAVENDKPILHFAKKMDVRIWPLVRG